MLGESMEYSESLVRSQREMNQEMKGSIEVIHCYERRAGRWIWMSCRYLRDCRSGIRRLMKISINCKLRLRNKVTFLTGFVKMFIRHLRIWGICKGWFWANLWILSKWCTFASYLWLMDLWPIRSSWKGYISVYSLFYMFIFMKNILLFLIL